MLESILKLVAALKEAPAFLTAIGNRLDRRQLESALRDLRMLHFTPEFRKRLNEAAISDFVNDPAAQGRLKLLLDESAVPVAEAIDRLEEFAFAFPDLPYEDFSIMMSFLDGKTTVRKTVSDILSKLETGATVSSAEAAAIEAQLVDVNKAIGQAHETIRMLASKTS